jgi:transketolase
MTETIKKQLAVTANKLRKLAVFAVYSAKSGHPGGSLSAADILTYLYFHEMNVDAKNPKDENRDRFVLSKGHCAPALYSALALKGYFPIEELKGLRHLGCLLQGHPDMKTIPGIDMSTGSLGQGISAACGMALSAKISKKDYRVYTVLGDGEIEEGQVYEAAMFAHQYKLDNLVAVIDNNGLQIDGKIDDVMSPNPIPEKFAAFGWNTVEINGHDFDEIEKAFDIARKTKGKPTAIIAHTVKGKGVSFMENVAAWHGTAPNDEQYKQAQKELDEAIEKLEVGD